MEQEKNLPNTSASKLTQLNTIPIRVCKDTARLIKNELVKLNKKDLGRRIKADDIINRAISKITEEDRRELQEKSMSNSDKLELLFRRQREAGSKLSKDEFLGQVVDATRHTLKSVP